MLKQQDVSQFLAALPFPSACVGQGGRLVAFNAAFRSVYGAARAGLPFELVARQPAVIGAVELAARTGEPQTARIEASMGQRDVLWHVTATPLHDEDDADWIILVFEDRTDVEESAQIRRDFVANVSHELRSPLTALMGFIETLKMRAGADEQTRARFLEIMEREAGRMSRLVQDLLSLSRVESEERLRPTETVELCGLIDGVLHLLAPTAREAEVEIRRVNLDAPIEIRGDSDQLSQVFTNLVENAIKYGGSGHEVTVAATRLDREPAIGGAAVRIDVIDRGEGFDPHHIPRLTERFYRIDNHRSRNKGGTGLGLAIVKHIVNRHRGRMRIESDPGKGSRFSVILPL